MNYAYYEIGGHVVTVEIPSAGITLPPVTSISRTKMSAPADLSSEAASASAGRNGNLTTPSAPSNIAMPYTVGVGRGSPRTWLGANVILWGAKMVHSRRPEYANYDKVM